MSHSEAPSALWEGPQFQTAFSVSCKRTTISMCYTSSMTIPIGARRCDCESCGAKNVLCYAAIQDFFDPSIVAWICVDCW